MSGPSDTPERIGPYRILERLGKGGMGAVYRAQRGDGSSEHVALKVLTDAHADPSLLERFRREGALLAVLEHPGIVGLRSEPATEGGLAYYAMELVDGQDLRQVLRERGAFTPAEALRIAIEVLEALDYAHAHEVVHRDVKPPNVLLDASGRARLADFGLARALEASGLTQTGTVLGTPEYMAPEQANGEPSDARTDLYAVGILLYELVSGAPPFRAERPLAILRAHCEAPIPPLRAPQGVPQGLEGILRRALAKAPDERWSSAGAMADALRSIEGAELVSTSDETLALPVGAQGASTSPLPVYVASGRGSAPTEVLPPDSSAEPPEEPVGPHAPEPPPVRPAAESSSAAPEAPVADPKSARPRVISGALLACVVLGASLALGWGARSKARDEAPAPSRGEERDWGSFGAPTAGAPETVARETMERMAYEQAERGLSTRAAVLYAGISLRSEDAFDRLRARGNALHQLGGKHPRDFGEIEARSGDLSADGSVAAVGHSQGIRVLVTGTGEQKNLGKLSRPYVSVSPDGSSVAAYVWKNDSSKAHPIELWDVASGKLRKTLSHPGHATDHLSWHPKGRWLLSVPHDPDRGMLLFDTTGELSPQPALGVAMRIYARPTWGSGGRLLGFSTPQGTGLYELGAGLAVFACDPERGRLKSLGGVTLGHSVQSLAWHPRGTLLAVGGATTPPDHKDGQMRPGEGRVVRVGTLAAQSAFGEISGHEAPITFLSWSPDGSRLVSGNGFGLRCWKVGAKELTLQAELAYGGLQVASSSSPDVPNPVWTPDGRYLVGLSGATNLLAAWNGKTRYARNWFGDDVGQVLEISCDSSPRELLLVRVLGQKAYVEFELDQTWFELEPGPLLDYCQERARLSVADLSR